MQDNDKLRASHFAQHFLVFGKHIVTISRGMRGNWCHPNLGNEDIIKRLKNLLEIYSSILHVKGLSSVTCDTSH